MRLHFTFLFSISLYFSAGNPQFLRMRLQSVDHKPNVRVEIDAEKFHAAANDLPIHLGGKRLALRLR